MSEIAADDLSPIIRAISIFLITLTLVVVPLRFCPEDCRLPGYGGMTGCVWQRWALSRLTMDFLISYAAARSCDQYHDNTR